MITTINEKYTNANIMTDIIEDSIKPTCEIIDHLKPVYNYKAS